MKTLLLLSIFIALFCLQATGQAQNFQNLDSLAAILVEQGKLDEALALRTQTLERYKGKPEEGFAKAYLGLSYLSKGQYPKAEKLMLEGLSLNQKNGLDTSLAHAELLAEFGLLYKNMNQYDQAEKKLQEADARLKALKQENSMAYAHYLHNLGGYYFQIEQHELAAEAYVKSLNLIKSLQGEDNLDYVKNLNNLASAYNKLNRLAEAEPLFLQVLSLREKLLGKQHASYANTLNNLASLYFKLNNLKKAEELLLEATAIAKQSLGEGHPNYVFCLLNLGNLYNRTGRATEAEAKILEGLRIRKKTLGEGHIDYFRTLFFLGDTYKTNKDFTKALAIYQEIMLKLNEEIEPQGNLRFDTRLRLVDILLSTNKTEEALQHLDSLSLQLLKQSSTAQLSQPLVLFRDFVPQRRQHLDLLAYYHRTHLRRYANSQNIKDLQQAFDYTKTALQASERMRQQFSNEQDKLFILSFNIKLLEDAFQSAKGLGLENKKEELFYFVEQNKAVLLADALKNTQARSFGDLPDSLRQEEQQLLQEADRLQKQRMESKNSQEMLQADKALANLNLKIQDFRKEIKNKYPKYHALKYENITAQFQDIQAILPPQTLLLEYYLTDSSIYIFALSRNNFNLYQQPCSSSELRKHIKTLRANLSDYKSIQEKGQETQAVFVQEAHWFYQQLIAPCSASLSDIKRLIILSDGELGHLPFEVFLTEKVENKKINYKTLPYLLRQYSLSYSYSATLLKENLKQGSGKHNGQLLAFAASYAPDKSGAQRPSRLQKLRNSLVDLPAAKAEVEALSKHFEGKFLFGLEASEAQFKREASRYGVLHLAMHGLLNPRSPILSSLAFSENGDQEQDNFLESWEIAQLQLEADLVVLSACETGFGKFQQGEGIVSLARSFMYAGVPALVVSMWEVNDASTAFLMEQFYRNLAKGMHKDEALRQAKLYYLQELPNEACHPAYWSAFIQMGNPQGIDFQARFPWYWLGLAGLVFVLGLGFWYWRRVRV